MRPNGDGQDQRRDERIIAVIRALREGEVATYGEIAGDAGFPTLSRMVGRLLALGGDDLDLPWWRVVNSAGRLVPGHEREQIGLLRAEGVRCENGRVRAARYGRFSRPRQNLRPDRPQDRHP